MTIIDVARELEKDGTKRFRRPRWGNCWIEIGSFSGLQDNYGTLVAMRIPDLLATDWEEVKE